MSGREVTLVLCTADGDLLGAGASFTVADPWWSGVEEVVTTARTVLGVEVRVLRILHMPGGQSGHPLSPHYGDQYRAWMNGEPTPFLPGPTVSKLTLRPK